MISFLSISDRQLREARDESLTHFETNSGLVRGDEIESPSWIRTIDPTPSDAVRLAHADHEAEERTAFWEVWHNAPEYLGMMIIVIGDSSSEYEAFMLVEESE